MTSRMPTLPLRISLMGALAALTAALTGANRPAAVHSAPLRVQAAAAVPCILLECGTLATAEGEAALTDEAAAASLADALAAALAQTLETFNAREQSPATEGA